MNVRTVLLAGVADAPRDLFSPRMPNEGTQHHDLLMAFQRGEVLTVGDALMKYRVYALSQRVGDLKRMGWNIESESVEGGKHHRYWMTK